MISPGRVRPVAPTASYALAYVDRQFLNLVVDPVKRSLLLSDTQLSFVQGLAFILAYLCAAPVFALSMSALGGRIGGSCSLLAGGAFPLSQTGSRVASQAWRGSRPGGWPS